jgi:hypothetical protein
MIEIILTTILNVLLGVLLFISLMLIYGLIQLIVKETRSVLMFIVIILFLHTVGWIITSLLGVVIV